MNNHKEIKRRLKYLIQNEFNLKKVKGTDFLDDDLDIENKSDIKRLKKIINKEFNTLIKTKQLRDCIDVNDVVDLIEDKLGYLERLTAITGGAVIGSSIFGLPGGIIGGITGLSLDKIATFIDDID